MQAPAGHAVPSASRGVNPFEASPKDVSTSRAADAAANLFESPNAPTAHRTAVGTPSNPFDTTGTPGTSAARAQAVTNSNPFGACRNDLVSSNPFGDETSSATTNPFDSETPAERAERLMREIDDI